MLLWTSSWIAGCLAFAALPTRTAAHSGWLALATLGMLGINYVLMAATRGLEKRQREKYGRGSKSSKYDAEKYSGRKYTVSKYAKEDDEYTKWVKSTWGDNTLGVECTMLQLELGSVGSIGSACAIFAISTGSHGSIKY
eukprot:376002-Pyramimonas_sp.AAC.1